MPNVVNLARRTPATHMLVVRHRDRPGVLAHVFNHLRQANLNVQETENIVFEGAEAAVARINLDGEPPSSLCSDHQERTTPTSRSAGRRTLAFSKLGLSHDMNRIHNFSAGPAVLPLEVLEEAQRNLLALPGVGMSILEISHRSKTFDDIIQGCEADMRTLAKIPSNYKVLFLQGGASLQFSMVPMNLLPAGGSADYIVTGAWGQKAVKEAKRVGGVKIAGTTEAEQLQARAGAGGADARSGRGLRPHDVQQHDLRHRVALAARDRQACRWSSDMSSDIFSRPVDVAKYALIYAGAQKNLAPAGVTLAIIREDMLKRSPAVAAHDAQLRGARREPVDVQHPAGVRDLRHAAGDDVAAEERRARGDGAAQPRKADTLYAEIDRTGYYRGHAQKDARSRMNVTFRLPSEDLEKKFAKDATAAGLDGLKGHRSVGGMRASIYNAFPEAGVDALVDFMQEFERKNG